MFGNLRNTCHLDYHNLQVNYTWEALHIVIYGLTVITNCVSLIIVNGLLLSKFREVYCYFWSTFKLDFLVTNTGNNQIIQLSFNEMVNLNESGKTQSVISLSNINF